jgi:hypothetical protein
MSANSAEEVCADGVSDSSCINLTDDLSPEYVAAIPEDPQADGTGSEYVVIKDDANRITVEAIKTEEQTQIIAAGGTDISVLDRVPGAITAYSVRLLRADYTGPAMTVRKSTGNTTDPTQDIGFHNEGELDTQALNSFCGTNNCYVQTWHDQSGNNHDVTQSTNSQQPQIYDGSSVITRNGKAAADFDGNDDGLLNTAQIFGGTATTSTFTVHETSETGTSYFLALGDESNGKGKVKRHSAEYAIRVWGGAVIFSTTADGTQSLFTGISPGPDATDLKGYLNGNQLSESSEYPESLDFTGGVSVGAYLDTSQSDNLDGYINARLQEVIVSNADESDNRAIIESSINEYFDIY